MDAYESRWAVAPKPAKAATEGDGAKAAEKKEEAQEVPAGEAAAAEKEKGAVEVDEAEQKRLAEEAAYVEAYGAYANAYENSKWDNEAKEKEFKEKFTKDH